MGDEPKVIDLNEPMLIGALLSAAGVEPGVDPLTVTIEYGGCGSHGVILRADDAEWAEEPDIDLGTCSYLLKNGEDGAYGPNTCSFGCSEEPECQTCMPDGGWDSQQRARAEAAEGLLTSMLRKLHEEGWDRDRDRERPLVLSNLEWDDAEQRAWRLAVGR